jgi:hypothetical protein
MKLNPYLSSARFGMMPVLAQPLPLTEKPLGPHTKVTYTKLRRR